MTTPSLFDADDAALAVAAATPTPELLELGAALRERWGDRCHLGTSSWHFPGWQGLAWARPYPESLLSRHGLAAYARHPLLRSVSLDRAFYRVLDAAEYAALAAQVPEDFRFVVKAPSVLTDAVQRDGGSGRPQAPNPHFLDPVLALQGCVRPSLEGLGTRLGVIVFQLSPLPEAWRAGNALLPALERLWQAVQPALQGRALAALELRDAPLLTPSLAAQLKAHGVRCVLGLHARLPPADGQLPMQRATWPGDLVCRWNLQRGQRYAEARDAWAPFDRLQSPDPATRAVVARVARATLDAGHRVFVTVNNKAEGSAPLSVIELARALLAA